MIFFITLLILGVLLHQNDNSKIEIFLSENMEKYEKKERFEWKILNFSACEYNLNAIKEDWFIWNMEE